MALNSWSVPGSLNVDQDLIVGKRLVIANAPVQGQVNADWNSTTGLSQILNKPVVPAVAPNARHFTKAGVKSTDKAVNGGDTQVTFDTPFTSTYPYITTTILGRPGDNFESVDSVFVWDIQATGFKACIVSYSTKINGGATTSRVSGSFHWQAFSAVG